MANHILTKAKDTKQDEFYTQMFDINNELIHYKEYFRGKTVLCNCDDPRVSNFTRFFVHHFELYGLKRLISVCYKNQDIDLFSQNDAEQAVYMVYDGDKNGNKQMDDDEIEVIPLKGNGDFRSPESIELLKQADVVVTNPPFSLFREYVSQLMEYGKDFLIIGNVNAISYKEIFPLIKDNKLWLGYGFQGGNAYFAVNHTTNYVDGVFNQETGLVKFRNCHWFTNIPNKKRFEPLDLFQEYTPEKYPMLDNFNAINVDKVADIPNDYFEPIAVPITFLDKYCPNQFEILGITKTWFGGATKIYPEQIQVDKNGKRSRVTKLNDGGVLKLDKPPIGKTYYIVDDVCYTQLYARILIKRKQQ